MINPSRRYRVRHRPSRRTSTQSGPVLDTGVGLLVGIASILVSYMIVDAILTKLGVAEPFRFS